MGIGSSLHYGYAEQAAQQNRSSQQVRTLSFLTCTAGNTSISGILQNSKLKTDLWHDILLTSFWHRILLFHHDWGTKKARRSVLFLAGGRLSNPSCCEEVTDFKTRSGKITSHRRSFRTARRRAHTGNPSGRRRAKCCRFCGTDRSGREHRWSCPQAYPTDGSDRPSSWT